MVLPRLAQLPEELGVSEISPFATSGRTNRPVFCVAGMSVVADGVSPYDEKLNAVRTEQPEQLAQVLVQHR
jgi:hypothetical protein